MAPLTDDGPLLLAAYGINAGYLHGCKTNFLRTRFVVQQLTNCMEGRRVQTTPTLLSAIRDFTGDENITALQIRFFLLSKIQTLKEIIDGKEHVGIAQRAQLGFLFETLHKHMPAPHIEEPMQRLAA